jgi:hypothetical protein
MYSVVIQQFVAAHSQAFQALGKWIPILRLRAKMLSKVCSHVLPHAISRVLHGKFLSAAGAASWSDATTIDTSNGMSPTKSGCKSLNQLYLRPFLRFSSLFAAEPSPIRIPHSSQLPQHDSALPRVTNLFAATLGEGDDLRPTGFGRGFGFSMQNSDSQHEFDRYQLDRIEVLTPVIWMLHGFLR